MPSVEMEDFSAKTLKCFHGCSFLHMNLSNSSQLDGQEILFWLGLTWDILNEDMDVKLPDLDLLKTLVDCANYSISNLPLNKK